MDFTKTSSLEAKEARLHIGHPRFLGKNLLKYQKIPKIGNKNEVIFTKSVDLGFLIQIRIYYMYGLRINLESNKLSIIVLK